MRLVADLFLLIRGKVGLGMGDGKLLAVVGALMGWKAPLVALFGGATVAVIVIIPAMFLRRNEPEPPADAADDEPPPPLPWDVRKSALWSLGVLTIAGLAIVQLGAPPWIVAIAVIALALADDFLGLTDPTPAVHEDDDALDDVGPGAVPFGPFLAVTALFWWFAEPYVTWALRHP